VLSLALVGACANLDSLTSGADSGLADATAGDSAPGDATAGETGNVDSGDARADSGSTDGEAATSAGDADASRTDAAAFAIPGTVSGLPAATSIVLATNHGDTVTVTANGSFAVPTSTSGPYVVSLVTQPAAPALCTVSGGAGTTASPSSLAVSCDMVASVASGGYHTCALLAGGGVDCWGDNAHAELGDETSTSSSTPVAVTGLGGGVVATALSVGDGHSCVLLTGGAVFCWGQGYRGELGNGSTSDSTHLVEVMMPQNAAAIAVAAGGEHSCAVLGSGEVACWGDNTSDQLGIGAGGASFSAVPALVVSQASDGGLGGATSVVAGQEHTCALLTGGQIACWGSNSSGQLGIGSTASSPAAVSVPGVEGAIEIGAGAAHTCALLGGADGGSGDGAVKCWGADGLGELGVAMPGGANVTSVPAVPVAMPAASHVRCGYGFTCALLTAGGVDCWGYNGFGQLGVMPPIAGLPAPVPGIVGATALATGDNSTCAVTATGVFCWGYDGYGQLGDGVGSQESTPVPVAGLTGAVEIAAAGDHACAVLADGGAACWGDNLAGDLGNGTLAIATVPVSVTSVAGATGVVAGNASACALVSGGAVACWGSGADGQLGNGATPSEQETPVMVTGLAGATAVAGGYLQTCALVNGEVECWGSNSHGQLGATTMTSIQDVPVLVAGLTGVIAVTSGGYHSCAATASNVYCWGENVDGQLGIGMVGMSTMAPVQVTGLGGATGLAAGIYHTCAAANGAVECWGDNSYGQLGNPAVNGQSPVPVPVPGLTGVTAVAAGDYFSCAIVGGGAVQCWGANYYGSLGDGIDDNQSSPVPVAVSGVVGAKAISGGGDHACALLADGGAVCWGWDGDGQLGDGVAVQQNAPVRVK